MGDLMDENTNNLVDGDGNLIFKNGMLIKPKKKKSKKKELDPKIRAYNKRHGSWEYRKKG
jgi:hypothetical protein